MAVESWTPSRRLQSAAVAERQRLERELERVSRRLEAVRAQLTELEGAQSELLERRRMLDLLVHGAEAEVVELHVRRSGDEEDDEPGSREPGGEHAERDARELRGAGIREVAVQVLAESSRADQAVHYRQWYAILRDAGYTVAGKDPEASFLTQIGRSPVVRRSTQAGIYELDSEFVGRARERLRVLRKQLHATHDVPDDASAVQLEEVRVRRFALRDEIEPLERRLQEALQTLGEPEGGASL